MIKLTTTYKNGSKQNLYTAFNDKKENVTVINVEEAIIKGVESFKIEEIEADAIYGVVGKKLSQDMPDLVKRASVKVLDNYQPKRDFTVDKINLKTNNELDKDLEIDRLNKILETYKGIINTLINL